MYLDKNQKIVATIEARMTSSRLPGKVLLPLCGKPALEHLVERLKKSKYLDAIVIATTINSADEPIVELAKKLDVGCYRGSENDVLSRVLGAAKSVNGEIIVEITGDCPAMDPELVDRGIEEYYQAGVDYAANSIKATYPNGFDVQVFSTAVLEKTSALTNDPIDRVHVSYFIYQHPEIFSLYNWEAPTAITAPDLRVTLDEQSDYEVLCKIFDEFYPKNPNFTVSDVVNYLLIHPEIIAINKYVKQKDVQEG